MTATPQEPTRRGTKPSKEVLITDAPNTTPVQGEIPGFEQEKIGDIERAADKYVEKRDLRMGIQREEIDAKALLTRLMHDNIAKIDHQDGTLAYTRGDYRIVITTKENVKVKIGEEPKDDFETDEDAQ